MSVEVTSSAFDDGGFIPARYTCDAEDVSPPLEWTGIPEAAKSLALVCDDPDAPGRAFPRRPRASRSCATTRTRRWAHGSTG